MDQLRKFDCVLKGIEEERKADMPCRHMLKKNNSFAD